MNKLIALIVFGLVFSFGVMSKAQTPDDMTPAEEDVCDVLEGAAYGLCNAYCEAMDCDSEEAQASDEACGKVLGNYETKTDVRMPCLGCENNKDCRLGEVCQSGECCKLDCRNVPDCTACLPSEYCEVIPDRVPRCCQVECPGTVD